MPIFGLGKKKESSPVEKPVSINDAVVQTTKDVSPEDAFKRTTQSPKPAPQPMRSEPTMDDEDDDLFADFPLFGDSPKKEQQSTPVQQQSQPVESKAQTNPNVQEEPLSLDNIPETNNNTPEPNQNKQQFQAPKTEQFSLSLDDEVPDLMDVPQNTTVDVKVRGDLNTSEIPDISAPEQTYNVENVEFGMANSAPEEAKKEQLLNYIVKKGKGRMELYIELHDMRKLSEDIDRLSAIEKKSDHGFNQVNEIHEHEKKLLTNLRKSLEDMHRQFNLMDALIFENNDNK